jgi:hypothetical protein
LTIDERIEALASAHQRITERHEALAESVQLLSLAQRQNEERFSQVTRNFEITLDSIKRLENIALAHEQRLDDLDARH